MLYKTFVINIKKCRSSMFAGSMRFFSCRGLCRIRTRYAEGYSVLEVGNA